MPRRPTIHARLVALAFALAAALVVPAAAFAQQVPRLEGQVTDLTSQRVLASGRAEIDRALSDLRSRHNIHLFVLFTDTIAGANVRDYARQVADVNSLGDNDALLVVAVRDRAYFLALDASQESVITASEASRVRTREIEPRLSSGDWAGAVVAGARGLGDAAAGTAGAVGPEPAGEPARGGGLNLWPVIAIGLLLLGGWWVWGAVTRSRRRKVAAEERDRQTGTLRARGERPAHPDGRSPA